MTTNTLRGIFSFCVAILLSSLVVAAPPRPLTDGQLDQVYAAGFDVKVEMDLDLAATNPDSVFVTGKGLDAMNQLLNQGVTLASANSGTRNTPTFDPNGTYMPNLQNLTVNNINITDQALQNASTMMNIFALSGDVAVGVNLNVIVNPVNSAFNIAQTNINWGTLNHLSDTYSTLGLQ